MINPNDLFKVQWYKTGSNLFKVKDSFSICSISGLSNLQTVRERPV